MLTSGLTSPSQAVQLAAMARIPGIEVVHGARNLLGHPAIQITVTRIGAGYAADHGAMGRSR